MKRLWIGIFILMIVMASCAYAGGSAEAGTDIPGRLLADGKGSLTSWDELTLTEKGDSYVARRGDDCAIIGLCGDVIYEVKGAGNDRYLFMGFTGFGEAGWAPLWVGDRYIALNSDGTLRLPGSFDYISNVSETSGMYTFTQGEKYGIITGHGDILFDAIFDTADVFADADIYLVSKDGKYGYVTFTGDYLTELRFESACPFRGEYALVKEGGKYGYIDRSGEYFIENTLLAAGEFDDGYAIVTPEKNKSGVINTDGRYILNAKYGSITRLTGLNAVCASENGEAIYYNLYPEYALEAGNISAEYPFEAPFAAVWIEGNNYVATDDNGRILLGPMHKIAIHEDGVIEAYRTSESMAPEYFTIDDAGNIFPLENVPSSFKLSDYHPNEGDLVVAPDKEPSLNKRASTKRRLPHVDGDAELLPLFSALVQATYPDNTVYSDEHAIGETVFTYSEGDYCYQRLVDGEADIIFVQDPPEERLSAIRNAGAELVLTPIAMEALVFIVNADNPIENLTLDQLKGVYSGEIPVWDDLGAFDLGGITAYQRPMHSGVQNWFESIMAGTDLMAAPKTLPSLLNWTVREDNLEYLNLPGAIGYSERFYCMELLGREIKTLSIDGVSPSESNIRSGAYPYTATIYAITRKDDDNPNTAAFLEWIQSDEAMALIQRSGFVPIRKINEIDAVLEASMHDGDGMPTTLDEESLSPRREGDLYGYVDAFGDPAIPARFTYAYDFEGSYALTADRSYYYGLINRRGAYVLPPLYYEISMESDDGVVIASAPGGVEHYFVLEGDIAREITGVSASLDMEDYMPNEGSLVAALDNEPTLDRRTSKKHRLPCTDGATALFPVYSAFVQAVYPDDTRYEYVTSKNRTPLITCTRTNEAYERLVSGDADVIFVAEPSDAQVADAAEKGVEFELTPFGKEAFVFIVNRSNPLENITVEEIRNVYSGKITDWGDLGVSGLGTIMAYQRPENSGSQTALQKLMGDIPLMKAPEGVVAWDMGDIIDTIEYRNLPNAIGYTFRFFCTVLADSDVKMLSVGGVAPTIENIRNDTYPITSTLYAVTRKGDDNPNTASFLEWIQSPQGMELVEKSGYVPWYEAEIDLGTFDDPA